MRGNLGPRSLYVFGRGMYFSQMRQIKSIRDSCLHDGGARSRHSIHYHSLESVSVECRWHDLSVLKIDDDAVVDLHSGGLIALEL